MNVEPREYVDAFGRPNGDFEATYIIGEGSVTVDDIERLPERLGASPIYRRTINDVVENVELKVFYLDAVNDGFKVSITLSIDSLGRFRLTSRAQCGPSAGSRVDGFS